MESSGHRARGLRRFGLRIVTFYFSDEAFVDVEAGDQVRDLAQLAERVVLDDEVIKDRNDGVEIEVVGRTDTEPAPPEGPVTTTAPEGTVGMLPTVQP